MPAERLPKPWKICSNEDAFWIEAANGARFAYSYFTDSDLVGTGPAKLSRDLARRVTAQILKLGS